MERIADIPWLGRLEEGVAVARAARKPIVLKPLGQGLGHEDDW